MLDNPEPGLTPEQAEVAAGEYFIDNIAGRYSYVQINIAMFMVER